MARKKRSIPEINAGSMADIAFLLLIFFLVTTTIETDTGIPVKLPPIIDEKVEVLVNDRNILEVLVNANNQLLVEGRPMAVEQLKQKTKDFVTNNGRDPKMSDSAQVAIVSIKSDRGTKYEAYISIWNELSAAYNELWDAEARKEFGSSYEDLSPADKKVISQKMYPRTVSEAEPESYGEEK